MTDALQELAALEAADSFVARHIAPTEAEIAAMLKAVGAELDLEYGNIFGSSWGTEGESDSRITILRRKRILNRLSTVIPPPIKKQRPVPVPDDDASDASDDLDAFDSDV